MKFVNALTLAAGLVSAAPAAEPAFGTLEARQSLTRNELVNGNSGNCPSVIFIYARASGESGNMVCSRISDLSKLQSKTDRRIGLKCWSQRRQWS